MLLHDGDAQLLDRSILNLPNSLFGDLQHLANLAERESLLSTEAETERQNLLFARTQPLHQFRDRLIHVDLIIRISLLLAHRLKKRETRIRVDGGVERDRGTGRRVDAMDHLDRRAVERFQRIDR